MVEHPDAAIIRRGYEAFLKGDMPALDKLITSDAVWHSPGKNPISGDYQGRDAIMEYFTKFATLSQGTFQTELKVIFADDNRGVVLTRDTASRNGKTMSWDGGVILHLCEGKLTEAWAFNLDQYAVDEFWA
ncbi:MAG: DUF4440 domain-containing protein [Symploca sp. SIO2E9]|nr:DUF4440 domain-containing protein [Symploca sp. SIO2E9]